jgi:1,2-diacylglycerol 3-beta-galactosyltransferase
MVGGGEGMGPLEKTAHAINDANLDVALVIIAGRNRELKNRLENHLWNIPVSVYGFVRTMPEFMQASNVLVTKAGREPSVKPVSAVCPLFFTARCRARRW